MKVSPDCHNTTMNLEFGAITGQSTTQPVTSVSAARRDQQNEIFMFGAISGQSPTQPVTNNSLAQRDPQSERFQFKVINGQSTTQPVASASVAQRNQQSERFQVSAITGQSITLPVTNFALAHKDQHSKIFQFGAIAGNSTTLPVTNYILARRDKHSERFQFREITGQSTSQPVTRVSVAQTYQRSERYQFGDISGPSSTAPVINYSLPHTNQQKERLQDGTYALSHGRLSETVFTGTTVKFTPPTDVDTTVNGRISADIGSRYQSINCMKEYVNKSFEELRFEDYAANRKGRAIDISFNVSPQQQHVLGSNCAPYVPNVSLPHTTIQNNSHYSQTDNKISPSCHASTLRIGLGEYWKILYPDAEQMARFSSPQTEQQSPSSRPLNGTPLYFTPLFAVDTIIKRGICSAINTRCQSITCMKEYQNKSFEELRAEDYTANRKGKTSAIEYIYQDFRCPILQPSKLGSIPPSSAPKYCHVPQSNDMFGLSGTKNSSNLSVDDQSDDGTDESANGLHCPVCFSTITELRSSETSILSTICGHIFCEPCINKILESSNKCPKCRTNIYKCGIRKLYF